MRLTKVRPGDIVLVDDGLPYHAMVVEKQRGRMRTRVAPLAFPAGRRLCVTRDGWRLARHSNRAEVSA
jgi:hypothetical protein